MVVPKSQDKMFHPPDDMKRDAHVPDFNSYLALYRTSLENPEGRSSMYLSFSAVLAVFALHCTSLWAYHATCLCLSIHSAACNTDMKYFFYFQLSGKRLLMNSFGRSQQQGQWCSTTLMWHKETYMSNSWTRPKPTCAIMLWTGLLRRRILVIKLPISGKQQQLHNSSTVIHLYPLICTFTKADLHYSTRQCHCFQLLSCLYEQIMFKIICCHVYEIHVTVQYYEESFNTF